MIPLLISIFQCQKNYVSTFSTVTKRRAIDQYTHTHAHSLKKQVDWQSNYMLSSLVLFFNSTIDMQHIKLKLVYFKSEQHKKPGGMRLSQWLTNLTEYVGSHDGFLRCNKSDEVLESFLTPPNQEKKTESIDASCWRLGH